MAGIFDEDVNGPVLVPPAPPPAPGLDGAASERDRGQALLQRGRQRAAAAAAGS